MYNIKKIHSAKFKQGKRITRIIWEDNSSSWEPDESFNQDVLDIINRLFTKRGPFLQSWFGLLALLVLISVVAPIDSKIIRSDRMDTIQRLNYGVMFQPASKLVLSQEYWTHTFHLRLPERLKASSAPRCSSNSSYCIMLNDVISTVHNIHTQTQGHVHEVIKSIKSLIPATDFSSNSKSTRSFLPFIGSLAETLFGTATVEDVRLLASHVNALNSQTRNFAKAMQHTEARLSSFMSVVDEKTTNLLRGIELNKDIIEKLTVAFNAKLITLEKILTNVSSMLVQQVNEASEIRSNLANFLSAVQSLVEGKISPFLIPRSKFNAVIKSITKSLQKHHKGFFLTYTDPSYFYSHAKFIYARHYANLYISVKFPVSTHEKPLQLYKIITLPVPLNNTSNHATQLLNIPDYLAVTHHHDYFVHLSSTDLQKCTSTPLSLCTNNLPLSPLSTPDCIMAIFENKPKRVAKLCDFRFVPNILKSQLIELSSTSVIVYKVDSLKRNCPDEQTIVEGCTFCLMNIPCKCSFSTDTLYLPPRLVSCYNENSNGTTLHPFNLALLQEFFDEQKLFNMMANTTFAQPITFEIPNFKIYNHSMNNILADDHKYHLSLKKMAEATKKDAIIFKHLAEPLANGIITIPNAWPDTNTFLIFGTMTATARSWVLCIFALYKLRSLTVAMGVLQNVVPARSQTLPVFIYKNPLVTTEAPMSLEKLMLSEISWVHGVFIACICIILFLMACIFFLWYKKPSKGTVLLLEVTSGYNCVLIPLIKLPLCPSYYNFSSPKIEDISVTSFPSLKITAVWQPFTVVDKQSGKSISIPNSVSISYIKYRRVTKILSEPFCAYLYISHHGHSTILPQQSSIQEMLDI
ncbi:hypothetical protein FSP39_022245 [Pinctada imbricata]|uniref:Uncharacterized protein n=1 Tax=Pinctada imbricata TaxID=66713 RepID=A0AA88YFB1_PINIB|nr:hypothetical protein FSP39_022245 [Pinctada imbricata]